MLTKGIVEKIITPYKIKVRLPIFDAIEGTRNATETNELSEAIICSISNSSNHVSIGDKVIVGFEDDDISKPIILGHLMRANGDSTLTNLKLGALVVNGNTNLNENTYIGNVTPNELKSLLNIRSNIQGQIDNITDNLGITTDFSNYVTIYGNQVINGTKTFTQSTYFTADITKINKNSRMDVTASRLPNYEYQLEDFLDKNNLRLGCIGVVQDTEGYSGTYLQARNKDSISIKTNDNVTITHTPTPPIDDVSTQIANTEWVRAQMQYILDTVYPIGSIYITVNPHGSPAKIFGGTWERLDDTFLVGAGNLYDVGDTGGSANAKLIKHTHNAVAAGSHSHSAELYGKYHMRDSDSGSGNWGAEAYDFSSYDTWSTWGAVYVSGTTSSAGSHTHIIDPTGDVDDGINENLPPYTAVFIYKRIPDDENTSDIELY